MKRRVVLGHFFGAAATIGFARPVVAQSYPVRTIKIVVPYAAGGSPDTVARILVQPLSAALGQSVVIENLPGSGGVAAIEQVKRAAPDGYTLIGCDAGHWAVNRLIRKQLPYNFEKDLAPVSMLSTSALFLAVHESVPATNLQELVAAVRARPGFYSYGSSGVGSLHHLTMEAFKAGLGLDILHVPYKGTGQSVPALAAGQVGMAIAAYNSVRPFAQSGKLRILAANTRERASILKEFPPMGDAGLKDFHFPGENALFAPAGTPRAVIDALSAAIARAHRDPETIAKLHAAGVEPPATSTAAALAETIQRDIARYQAAVKAAKIEPD
jgi:tripartite-type tricarboxylate transporter receptor subunit TctC